MWTYLQQRWSSFGYAFKGIATLFQTQAHAWLHLLAALLVIIAGLYFGIERWEWAILTGCITLVIAAEALNTAIEFLTDLASPEYHPLAGKAKDTAAAAVLFCAMGAVVIGIIVFWPYLT